MISEKAFRLATYSCILFIFLTKLLFLFFLPSHPSKFGPDEGTYAYLVEWLATGLQNENFPNYGPGLYESSKSLVLPSILLTKIGLTPLEAVRVISSTYNIFSQAALAFFVFYLIKNKPNAKDIILINYKNFFLLFVLFAFIPSRFIWSSLGLRESSVEFWVICIFIIYFLILDNQKQSTLTNIFLYLFLIFSLIALSNSRPQVVLIMTLSLILSSFIFFKRNVFKYLLLQFTVFIFFAFNYQRFLSFFISSNGSSDPIRNLINKQQGNSLNAESAITLPKCPLTLDELECSLYRIPLTTFTFLFRPLIAIDTSSFESFLAGIENIFWLIVVIVIIYLSFNLKLFVPTRDLLLMYVFFLLYVTIAGLYEGNMGTAFRHKSLIFIIWFAHLFFLFCKFNTKKRYK